MVLQEDAILHSEDVRNNFFCDLGFIYITGVVTGKWNVLFVCLCFVLFCFNAEFKEDGDNNNTSSIPVSMPLEVLCGHILHAAPSCLWTSAHFPEKAGVGIKVGLVSNELLLEKMAATAEEAGFMGEVKSRDCLLQASLWSFGGSSEGDTLNPLRERPMPGSCLHSARRPVDT